MATLSDRLDHVLGGAVSRSLDEALGLVTVGDLLRHYPRRYINPGRLVGERRPEVGEHVTIVARIASATEQSSRKNPGKRFLKVTLSDGVNTIGATFFNPQKVRHAIKPGRRGMFSGVVSEFRGALQLTHPGYVLLPEVTPDSGADHELVPAGRRLSGGGRLAEMARASMSDDAGGLELSEFDRDLVPIYPATKEIQSWTIWRCVRQVLDVLDPVPEPLPEDVRGDLDLAGIDWSLRTVHLPDSQEDVDRAQERLRFDEAAALQLFLAMRRRAEAAASAPACPAPAAGLGAAFDAALPFELTEGQRSVGDELSVELGQTSPMNRLLQGEVGSGKTIVALRAMLQAVDSGHQCVLLAPTEVLAAQHVRSLRAMLGPLGSGGELGSDDRATSVVLLTGSLSAAARRAALLSIVDGSAGIVVGTHALLEDRVEFFDLGLVIVDEQHRFGVEQRDALRRKGRQGNTPHLLVMTATPIPRTIAMTVFGDLAVSTLRELPRGRSPITTNVVSAREHPRWVERAWERITEEVGAGRQAYVVCSRIGGDDVETAPSKSSRKKAAAEPTTQAAIDVFETLRGGPLSGVRVELLHGRLPGDEKDSVMRAFAADEVDVLVCTTVVEVGVDVPNATVMVIVDADRFGVSQLHQLRGRIGRGGHAGLCILITEAPAGSGARRRLDAVAATTDGFELARLDLEERREGDVLGAAQSGQNTTLRLLSLLEHEQVIERARAFATAVVERDPDLSAHAGLASMVTSVVRDDSAAYLEKS